MTTYVVDTNVAVVANGRNTTADAHCRLACVNELRSVAAGAVVAIDDGTTEDKRSAIMKEYARRLNFSGAPGAGDVFFKYVFDNQYRASRVRRVPVTPSENDRHGFDELPENDFDRSDRKFLAVAVVARATVLNATDSDWDEHASLMEELGVEIHQLCPQHARKQTRR